MLLFSVLFLTILFPSSVPRSTRQLSAGIQKVMQDMSSRIADLEEDQDADRETLSAVTGFFNAIGIKTRRKEGEGMDLKEHDVCGGWQKFSESNCIKLMPSVYTMEEAVAACANEYKQDFDLEFPSILIINSDRKQEIVTHLIQTGQYSALSGFWIRNSDAFSNWGSGSPSGQKGRSCIEMRNDGNPTQIGKWLDVTCDRKSSLICEKSVSISYLEIIKKVLTIPQQGPTFKDFQTIHTIVRDQTSAINNFATTLKSLQDKNNYLTSLIQNLAKIEDLNKIQYKSTELEAELQSTKSELSQLQSRLSYQVGELSDGKDEIENLSQKVNELRQELSQIKEERSTTAAPTYYQTYQTVTEMTITTYTVEYCNFDGFEYDMVSMTSREEDCKQYCKDNENCKSFSWKAYEEGSNQGSCRQLNDIGRYMIVSSPRSICGYVTRG